MKTAIQALWRRFSAPPSPRRCVECYVLIPEGVQCESCRAEMQEFLKRIGEEAPGLLKSHTRTRA